MFNPFIYFNPLNKRKTRELSSRDEQNLFLKKKERRGMELYTVPQNQYGGHIGQTGCLFLCLMYQVKPTLLVGNNIYLVNSIYHECIARGYMQKNCYVLNRESILKFLEVKFNNKRNPNLDIMKNLVRYSDSYDHFVVVQKGTDSVVYDPMQSSVVWLGGV